MELFFSLASGLSDVEAMWPKFRMVFLLFDFADNLDDRTTIVDHITRPSARQQPSKLIVESAQRTISETIGHTYTFTKSSPLRSYRMVNLLGKSFFFPLLGDAFESRETFLILGLIMQYDYIIQN
jgi:hypothetical protein